MLIWYNCMYCMCNKIYYAQSSLCRTSVHQIATKGFIWRRMERLQPLNYENYCEAIFSLMLLIVFNRTIPYTPICFFENLPHLGEYMFFLSKIHWNGGTNVVDALRFMFGAKMAILFLVWQPSDFGLLVRVETVRPMVHRLILIYGIAFR